MSKLLQINSSVFSQGGQSSQLADHYVEAWRKSHPDGIVTIRDLAQNPVPHLDGARVGAFFTPAEKRNAEQQAVIEYSDALIREIEQADIIVLAAPMYNFGIPSGLKAYFDHIARAGVTFRYTDKGAVGLLTNKKVIVFSTRGGLYAGTPKDTLTPYVRDFLGFLGLTDITFIHAEGLSMGDDKKSASLHEARTKSAELAA